MRVETNKKNQPAKNETSNFKTKKSVFDSTGATKINNAAKPPPTQGAFAKILEEARQQSNKSKTGDKPDAPDSALKTSDSDDEKKINQGADRKKDPQQKNNRGDGEGGQNSDENSAAFGNFAFGTKPSGNVPVPAARAILHVADLERILSVVRAQKLNEERQILIALKNSVLEGLQIRILLNESGNLKAEFLAPNKQIKKQLKKRERELSEILRQRCARFKIIDILLQ